MIKTNHRTAHKHRMLHAQGMLEFALALPILLLLIFGIIEFGRLLQVWLALENGARFGIRYAITGSYNAPKYCGLAGDALGLKDEDAADGSTDCRISKNLYPDHWEEYTQQLEDWARLPSIRDATLAGATGIGWNPASEVSGNYLDYLSHRSAVFLQDYRGNPSLAGYLNITICSSRRGSGGSFFRFDPNKQYYGGNTGNGLYAFPDYCEQADKNGNVISYIDDAGDPGDRIHVVITYRHQLITPFLSSWWPTLPLQSEREGLIEKFRQSRVTGLIGDNPVAATWTNTPPPEPTATFTPTPYPCENTGRMTREWWTGDDMLSVNTLDDFLYHPRYPYDESGSDEPTSFQAPSNWGDHYGQRMRGYLCAPYTGKYTFYLTSDDESELYISGDKSQSGKQMIAAVSGWTTEKNWMGGGISGEVYLEAGHQYYVEAVHREGGGDDHLAVAWAGPGIATIDDPVLIGGQFLSPVEPDPDPVICGQNSILREWWNGISGSSINNLTSNVNYPYKPDGFEMMNIFEAPTNQGDNFGQRFRGKICAPFTGDYYFAIASDDQSVLMLSNSEDPAGAQVIAGVPSWTNSRQWDKYQEQRSGPIHLEAGQLYYVEAIHKEGSGGDNLAVAWSSPYMPPNRVIEGKYLLPAEPAPPRCDIVTFNDTEALYLQQSLKQIRVHVENASSILSVRLDGVEGKWNGNWHNSYPGDIQPTSNLQEFGWALVDGSGYAAFYTPSGPLPSVSGSSPITWQYTFTDPYIIDPQEKGMFVTQFQTSFYRKPNGNIPNTNYTFYHGLDFETTLHYHVYYSDNNGISVTSEACTAKLSGLPGPSVEARVLNNNVGEVSLRAVADASSSRNGGVNKVYFDVFDFTGKLVHSQVEGSGPYCLFGDDSSAGNFEGCAVKLAYGNTWSTGEKIKNGTYTISIVVEDKGGSSSNPENKGSSKYSTRIKLDVKVNQRYTPTASSTPKPTNTPTRTPTPTRTERPTETKTPKPTKTPTRTPNSATKTKAAQLKTDTYKTEAAPTEIPDTPTPSRTFTAVQPEVPTNTATPKPTRTPTPTQNPNIPTKTPTPSATLRRITLCPECGN